MADNELQVIIKSKKLAEHTLRVTSNCNRYPKKFRFSLVDKMQIKSLEIYEKLMEANRTDLKEYRRERLELQTQAITYCDELLFLKGDNKRRIKRKVTRWVKLVKEGKMTEKKFYGKYNAWKNHALHGNCIKLCHSMDLYIKELMECK